MKPLTSRQESILVTMLMAKRHDGSTLTPSHIARALGFAEGGRRRGSGAAGRGGWSGYMSPANRVIGSLNGLERRRLARHAPEYTYGLTLEGEKIAASLADSGTTSYAHVPPKTRRKVWLNELRIDPAHPGILHESAIDMIAGSMQTDGQRDPIYVNNVFGRYHVIDGVKRVAAAKVIGLDRLDAIVVDGLTHPKARFDHGRTDTNGTA